VLRFVPLVTIASFLQAFIHMLRCEGLKLNENPVAPVDTRQRPKGHEYKKPEDAPEWAEYTDWVHELNRHAINAFLRAVGSFFCSTTYTLES